MIQISNNVILFIKWIIYEILQWNINLIKSINQIQSINSLKLNEFSIVCLSSNNDWIKLYFSKYEASENVFINISAHILHNTCSIYQICLEHKEFNISIRWILDLIFNCNHWSFSLLTNS